MLARANAPKAGELPVTVPLDELWSIATGSLHDSRRRSGSGNSETTQRLIRFIDDDRVGLQCRAWRSDGRPRIGPLSPRSYGPTNAGSAWTLAKPVKQSC